MYNLNSEICEFLSNIEPEKIHKEQAAKAQSDLRDFLKSSATFKDLYADSFLTGSYKRHTAIKEIKDVDIIVILNKPATLQEPNENIKDLFNTLKTALKEKYELEQIEQQRRSIKLIWKFENKKDNDTRNEALTIDIVMAIRSEEGSNYNLWIPDKNLDKWIRTNPLGHIDKITEKNQSSSEINGQRIFVPTIKVLKFWKGQYYKTPKRPKGFLLECILFHSWNNTADNWLNCLNEAFQDIKNKYGAYKHIDTDSQLDSVIEDIGLEGKYIYTSTTYKNFKIFIEKVEATLTKLNEAKNADTKYDAIKKLQEIFGSEYFPSPKETDKDIKNAKTTEDKSISIITGSNKNPEAKPYG